MSSSDVIRRAAISSLKNIALSPEQRLAVLDVMDAVAGDEQREARVMVRRALWILEGHSSTRAAANAIIRRWPWANDYIEFGRKEGWPT